MTITQAHRRRGSWYQLELDGAEGPLVDRRTFDESAYRVGSTVTPEQLEALLTASQHNRAREKALYLLGLRDYARAELERRLAREVPLATATAVADRLTEVGLLDDERYAAHTARSLSQHKGYSRRRVEQELRRRGVERETAARAAAAVDSTDFEQALALLRKKYYNKLSDYPSRQRVAAALARQGFSYSVIRQAMEALGADRTEDENENEEYDDSWR